MIPTSNSGRKLYKPGDIVIDGETVYVDRHDLPPDITTLCTYNVVCDYHTGAIITLGELGDKLPQPPLDYAKSFPNDNVGTIDVEVYPEWWCVVLSDGDGVTVFRSDKPFDSSALKRNLHSHDFVMGYNIREYDCYMLQMMVEGCSPTKIYEATKRLINRNGQPVTGWELLDEYCKYPKNKYIDFGIAELMPAREAGGESVALKYVEGIVGERIFECPIPFDKEDLSEDEKETIIEYCKYDVEMTERIIYANRAAAVEVDIALAKMCVEADRNKSWREHLRKSTNSKAAVILGANKRDYSADEWLLTDHIIALKKCFQPQSLEHKKVYHWFAEQAIALQNFALENPGNYLAVRAKVRASKYNLTLNNGCEVVFGMGGQHGAFPRFIKAANVYDTDVSSMYPGIMCTNYEGKDGTYNLISRRVTHPEKYERMTRDRIALKQSDPLTAGAYKQILVTLYGAMGNVGGPLYDPRNLRAVCITGQLALLKLIEMLEPYVFFVNTNTDGIFWTLNDGADFHKVLALHEEWQNITGLQLEVNGTTKDGYMDKETQKPAGRWVDAAPCPSMSQFDVNNYILQKSAEKIAHKGAKTSINASPFERGTTVLPKYDKQIIKKAIAEKIINGTPIEETINACTDFRQFCFVAKSTKPVLRDGEPINERILRFALVNEGGSNFTKQTDKSVASIPFAKNCELFHGDLNNLFPEQHLELIERLNISEYIAIAEHTLDGLTFDHSRYEGTFAQFCARYPYWSPISDNGNYPIHKTNDPASWEMLEDTAFPACMLPQGDVWGVDIDDCLHDVIPDGGNPKDYVKLKDCIWRGLFIHKDIFKWLEKMNVYTELSGGGHGLHCIVTANASEVAKKSGSAKIGDSIVELFNTTQANHSITVTGKRIECFSDEIKSCTRQIKALLKTLPDRTATETQETAKGGKTLTSSARKSCLMNIIHRAALKVDDKNNPEHRYIAFRNALYHLEKLGYTREEKTMAANILFEKYNYMGDAKAANRASLLKI